MGDWQKDRSTTCSVAFETTLIHTNPSCAGYTHIETKDKTRFAASLEKS